MKPLPISFLIVALVLANSVPASAASPVDEIVMREMTSRLSLTEDQQTQIGPVVERRNTRLTALRADLGEGAPRRQRLKALREARSIQQEFVGEVSPLLTKEQKVEWEDMRKEMREEARELRRRE